MGLDITAYSNVVRNPIARTDRVIMVHHDKYYFEDWHYFSISYSTFAQWRRQLALLAGYQSLEDAWASKKGPFIELLIAEDTQDVFWSIVCKNLLADFSSHENKALEMSQDFRETYKEFATSFRLASNDGVVLFT